MHTADMFIAAIMSVLFAASAQTVTSDSLFSRLVEASSKSDQRELIRLLSTETLSSSTGTVVEGNRVNGGEMRHDVPVEEIAAKLQGCTVKKWRDEGSGQGTAFILWECPTKPTPENDCYFYSYRAEMLNPRYHPANLFIHEMPSWDARCGIRRVAPPRL